ncbi:MAG: acetyl-CoA carboxylase biotin carboxylase subunit [Gemmatimonadota bacterium]|uniref:acetyl-CoA carboxylase biotin carboxylase subunit n=1 Tax=Candidatus Palauibacter scopulicola TaxID=3056741 RepID=UPI0023A1F3AF|nr:acetyl-CoA carboxylase biotin carboxylase subunit [Candidatus Palauibacter scopulicola]MDE2664002.1 acetyl-CoA carboxylase biotin carboxylase subunit [Candidatus Palauibacter scopulicola]
MFDKVLIANRGEIAVRVIRACHEEGLGTVAVYSDADRQAPHVLLAGEAVRIGGAAAVESYLSIDRLVAAAEETGAGAVHPGYGFLAENADFARAVEAAGLVHVGPPAEAIEIMGDKTRARARMVEAGVPVIPGSDPLASARDAVREAGRIGFPVLLKAAAGGGGKGMHVVSDAEEIAGAFGRATREARAAFGDGRVFAERFLRAPRHIEIQVLADDERTVDFGERECSIQRRHQKLIEEAPSTAIGDALRRRMAEVAVRAAEAVGYRSAGTVEFLVEGREFFFLEMNTRIQVEHPVTELVTGVDLVRQQLRVARGLPLLGGGAPPAARGHAIECRINAEDPTAGFVPSTGRIDRLEVPTGPGVRWDGGIRNGSEVGPHYDSLLGKLVVHASDREAAIRRMRSALEGLVIGGVETTVPWHLAVMDEPDYRMNDLSIRYVEEHPGLGETADPELRDVAMAAAVLLTDRERPRVVSGGARRPRGEGNGLSAWVRAGREW